MTDCNSCVTNKQKSSSSKKSDDLCGNKWTNQIDDTNKVSSHPWRNSSSTLIHLFKNMRWVKHDDINPRKLMEDNIPYIPPSSCTILWINESIFKCQIGCCFSGSFFNFSNICIYIFIICILIYFLNYDSGFIQSIFCNQKLYWFPSYIEKE